ncbi:CDP-6-deoxy-L-threo-D-glycero-4-hexulose-3-dehydrase reductase [Oligella urethralis]|uniref:CDP-6-deoxy-delta-3,4-glucoseen reductase n=1 Tax=Oligella TaxID=90243 RepID=UPI0008A584E6|nr:MULTISPECIES: CDP-6-deoxy-delta-3,4-glucoseen reductase [Oligella]OFV50672.1 CDP-6-deoxy-delta-3,4-glucoseen reductase [Oligella sp. HMSC09E12]WOS37350.1 CDP-6-deoxy-L-threo-D-glycero-4-hexulose-3-dehydrase reductase [Oligella urethralis]SUA55551.1 CDP-6-deoxy-L-threo-D-glycero-4-hexulose-3-dehydrase reductase [Oligella urethralis]
MSYKVEVMPSGHQFTVKEGQIILDAALDAGVILPYSCRSGSCISCKGKVVAGDYDPGIGTEQMMSPDEMAEGYTLFCQTTAQSDLVIESLEVRLETDIITRKMPARVLKMDRLNDDVMLVQLQMPSTEPFRYYAGQYLDFIFKDNVRRSYSIAVAPEEGKVLELHIRHMPGGMFTDRLFGVGERPIKEREILRIEGPLGTFFLREDSDKPMIFVASGTGFSPIKALMEDIIAKDIQRPITFYWGGRRPKDLYMNALVEQWAADLPFFNYIPVVSDALPEDQWQGRTGFVHQAVLDDVEDLSGYQVYACGAPIVVESARKSFINEKGLPETEFFADAFTSAKDGA